MNEPELTRRRDDDLGHHGPAVPRMKLQIARAIIEARIKRGWTQQKLAKVAGTKQSRISEIESAKGNPTIDTIECVLKALEIDVSIPATAKHHKHSESKRVIVTSYLLAPHIGEQRSDAESDRFEEVEIPPEVHAQFRRSFQTGTYA